MSVYGGGRTVLAVCESAWQQGGGGGYAQGPPGMMGMMDPNQLMANPLVTDMAMQYGQQFMGKGQEEIKKNLDKYISIGQLKYYFAVDTSYVAKKLGILLFPVSLSERHFEKFQFVALKKAFYHNTKNSLHWVKPLMGVDLSLRELPRLILPV